jgi:hypothetical protein
VQRFKQAFRLLRIAQVIAVVFLSLMMARAVKMLFLFMRGDGTP